MKTSIVRYMIDLATAWHELLNRPDDLQSFREKSRHAAWRTYSVQSMRDRFLGLAVKWAAG